MTTTTVKPTTAIRESAFLLAPEAVDAAATGTLWRARIIAGDIWGSSGWWPADVIERDGPLVWPQGTKVFYDHPTPTEDAERPVRSVKDIIGWIDSTPVYENDGLYANVRFIPSVAAEMREKAPVIGLSVRCGVYQSEYEAGGKTGYRIDEIVEGYSVDVVTEPGAKGALIHALEHKVPPRPRSADEVKASEVRKALSTAATKIHGDYAYVADYDTDILKVWVEVWDDEEYGTEIYEHSYTFDGFTAELSSGIHVVRRTIYVSPDPVMSSGESKETPAAPGEESTNTGKDSSMATIDDAELQALRDKAAKADEMQKQLDAHTADTTAAEAQAAAEKAANERDAALSEAATMRAAWVVEQARRVIAEHPHEFDALQTKGLLADELPVNESKGLDETAFMATVTKAAESMKTTAPVAESAPIVTGMGSSVATEAGTSTPAAPATANEADVYSNIAEIFHVSEKGA